MDLITILLLAKCVMPIQELVELIKFLCFIIFHTILEKCFDFTRKVEIRGSDPIQRNFQLKCHKILHAKLLFASADILLNNKKYPGNHMIGWGYYCYIDLTEHWCSMELYATKKIWNEINKTLVPKITALREIIKNDLNPESFSYTTCNKKYKKIIREDPRYSRQVAIENRIISHFQSQKYKNNWEHGGDTFVLLHGDSGCGKSTTARLIAQDNKYLYCKDYLPHRRGHKFSNLDYERDNKPLIIVLEEFDKLLEYIFQNKKYNSSERVPEIIDKTSLNNLLDNLCNLDGIMLIATSNRSIEWFSENYPYILKRLHLDFDFKN